jgi:two-component system, LytTR family, sensor kinase
VVNKQRLYWTLQVSSWIAYAVLQIVVYGISTGAINSRRIVFFLLEALIGLLLTHGLRHLLIHRFRWMGHPLPKLIPRVLLAVSVLAIFAYALQQVAIVVSGRSFSWPVALNAIQFVYGWSFYTILFFLWSVFYFAYFFVEQYNKSLRYEASRIEIELNNLKSQLNPHFIFNALNSIRALVDENPKKSKQAINHLSNILRNSLAADRIGLTKFEDELKIVKDYLSLETIRFEERLKTEFDIHPDSGLFLVPPLMIQTLVENGIKHGVSKLTEGGTVSVKTSVENAMLKIQIRNSGQYHLYHVNGIKRKGGLGLKNTAQRLKLLYGENASFKIENESDTFVLTEIIIPQSNESTDRRR